MESRAPASTQIEMPLEAVRPRLLSLLVIDDDPVHRMVIGKVGEKTGYTLTTASSIDDAAVKIETQKFDCISLDLSLGGQNGAQVLGTIARHNKDALLIVISGAAAQVREDTLRLANELAIQVIEAPKPVDLVGLRSKLVSLAESAKA